LEISPDGKSLATSGEPYSGRDGFHEDATIRIWDVAKRAERCRLTRGAPYSGPLRFTPDGRTLVYADGGTLHFAATDTGKDTRLPSFKGVKDFTFAAGGRWLVTVGGDRTVRLWELATGLELHRVAAPDCGAYRVEVAQGGRALLTLNEDGTVLVWDLAPGGTGRRDGPDAAGKLWADLASGDGPTAYRAVWALPAEP